LPRDTASTSSEISSPACPSDRSPAAPGDLVYKPRGQGHTSWNAGDEQCRILEIIAPAGFEKFFDELVDAGGSKAAGPEKMQELSSRYAIDFMFESIPELCGRFGLTLG
jgi:hypothetical protein